MLVLDPARAWRTVLGACVVVTLATGCGASAPGHDATSDALVAGPTAEPPEGAAALGAGGAAAAEDPDAPASYKPVVRPGKGPPSRWASAGRLAAGAPVRYPDGVAVTVERVARVVEQGEGTGAFPGRPLTAVTLSLTNGSAAPLDLSQVVVTTAYGQRPKLATPVYSEQAQDFTGTVAPGAAARATYVFAIPPGQAAKVSTWVDFDAVHAAAAFHGPVQ